MLPEPEAVRPAESWLSARLRGCRLLWCPCRHLPVQMWGSQLQVAARTALNRKIQRPAAHRDSVCAGLPLLYLSRIITRIHIERKCKISVEGRIVRFFGAATVQADLADLGVTLQILKRLQERHGLRVVS